MDVRVCGPNLRDQRKGSFHVHADGCADLRKYGPEYRGRDGYGGDLNGNREMLVKDASVYKVVEATYADQIDENVNDEQSREDIANDYASDFWFAPCCGDLPWRTDVVYECWLSGTGISHENSQFLKFKSDEKSLALVQHITDLLQQLTPHQHIHIVAHYSDEYTS